MTLPEDGALLRIFVGESDRHEGKLLYEWLVLKAKERGLAGATVLRGVMGFGAHSRLHTFKIERLSEDLPVVVENDANAAAWGEFTYGVGANANSIVFISDPSARLIVCASRTTRAPTSAERYSCSTR